MAPSKTGKSAVPAAAKVKKEKVFHPESRKAGQIVRKSHRKERLGSLASKRGQKNHTMVDIYNFFFDAMPDDGRPLTLDEMHALVRNVWLARFDAHLEEEIAARRKGRPKNARQIELEDLKLRESELYRTGMEVPDLTHATNVELFRRWNQKDAAFPQLLRFIRISSSSPEKYVVSRRGKHQSLIEGDSKGEDSMQLDGDEVIPSVPTTDPLTVMGEPPTRFSSTIMSMDGLVAATV